MRTRYDSLREFFLAYFHPDWQLDAGTIAEVVREFREVTDPELAKRVADDLRELLAEPLSETELHDRVVNQYSVFYDPWLHQTTTHAWLVDLLSEIEGDQFE